MIVDLEELPTQPILLFHFSFSLEISKPLITLAITDKIDHVDAHNCGEFELSGQEDIDHWSMEHEAQ